MDKNMRRRAFRVGFWRYFSAIFLVAGVLTGCSRAKEAQTKRPNVLLIVIDTARPDHFGCYGYKRDTSPNIDRFSAKATLFQTAYCQMPTTGPALASIFTSLYPRTHGVLKNGWDLSGEFPTFAEVMKRNEYYTAGFISSFVLTSKFGYSRGFDHYDERFPPGGGSAGRVGVWGGQVVPGEFDERADITTTKAVKWLSEEKKEPFFLWVHYYDPHSPYNPPPPYDTMFIEKDQSPEEVNIAKYDGEIRFADEQVGKLLEAVQAEGLDSNTLIIIMSDHGEGLGQHGWQEHGMFLYDEQTRIVLMMSLPGKIPAGKEIDSVVQAVDILPTVVDMLGLQMKDAVQGSSLASMILEQDESTDSFAFIQRRPPTARDATRSFKVMKDQYAIRRGSNKYIWAPEEGGEELYNLVNDPHELSNIAAEKRECADEMRNSISKLMHEHEGRKVAEPVLDKQTREKLKALGYVQ